MEWSHKLQCHLRDWGYAPPPQQGVSIQIFGNLHRRFICSYVCMYVCTHSFNHLFILMGTHGSVFSALVYNTILYYFFFLKSFQLWPWETLFSFCVHMQYFHYVFFMSAFWRERILYVFFQFLNSYSEENFRFSMFSFSK